MRRIVMLVALVGGLFPPATFARTTQVLPGVRYSHVVEFTMHGPVSMFVIEAPRPIGLYGLQPVLSNGRISGRQRVSSIQRDVAAQVTTIGINGDLFSWAEGHPTGILIRDRVLDHHPAGGRSSIGVDDQGTLHVERLSFAGSWQGMGVRHRVNRLNERNRRGEVNLFTPAWGARTPAGNQTVEIVLRPFPRTVPNTSLIGAVASVVRGNGATRIPTDGAVLVGRGAAAEALLAEAPVGATVTVRLVLKPAWSEVVNALGGGPRLVRDGQPVFRSLEAFTPVQLYGRDPRAAVGQRADGSIVLVAVDGRQPGYSIGITNFDLALTLVRLGCVTASAVDAGGSVTVAFDGTVLNRPSDPGGERAVAEALLVTYAGVYAPRPAPTVSPNGDGVAETEMLRYKVVRPSTVSARLLGPEGQVRDLDIGVRPRGTYAFRWSEPGPEGRWRWSVSALDDLGRESKIDRAFSLDNTLGFLTVGSRRPGISAAFTLSRPAKIRVAVETRAGDILRTIARGRRASGRVTVGWKGRDGRGRLVPRGRYVLHVAATSELGTSSLTSGFRIVR